MGQSHRRASGRSYKVKTSPGCQLCYDSSLVMINFTMKGLGGDILDELGLHCKTQHERVLPGDGEVGQVCIALVLIFMDSETIFHDDFAINRRSLFLLFLCGRREFEISFV